MTSSRITYTWTDEAPALATLSLLPIVQTFARAAEIEVETAEILTVPVRHFLPDAPVEVVEEDFGGWVLRYGCYPVAGHRVWGATGRAMAQLGAVLGPNVDD